jgi:peroxiredoxin
MTQLKAGIPAAPITLPDLGGKLVTLDLRSPGPKVLIFYKESCPTCRFGLPLYDRLHGAFAATGFPMYGVIQNTPAEARAFARAYGIRMPQLVDDSPYEASRAYHVLSVPTMVVIDGEGRVAFVSPAFVKEDVRRVAALLAEAAGSPVPELFAEDEDVPALRPG